MMSGVSRISSSASAPPSTPISTGWYSRMYGAQQPEVVLVVVAPHDDERVAPGDLGAQRRQLQRREGEDRLALDVLEGVRGEPLELGADAGLRLVHAAADLRPRRARVPLATSISSTSTRLSCSSTRAPSAMASRVALPTPSSRTMPARTSRSGPPFG